MESKIDFEGKKYALVNTKTFRVFPEDEVEVLGNGNNFYVGGRSLNGMLYTLHTNPDYKEREMIYTQEMEDKGEEIKHGMSCQAYIYAETRSHSCPLDSWVDVTFQYKCKAPNSGSCYMVKDSNGINHIVNSESHIKAIDTRTDEEKAIDYIELKLKGMGALNTHRDTAEVLFGFIFNKKICGISFTGDKK